MRKNLYEIMFHALDFTRRQIRIPKRRLRAKERGMAIEQREKVFWLRTPFFKFVDKYDLRVGGGFKITEWKYLYRLGISNTSGEGDSSNPNTTCSGWHSEKSRTINYNREGRLVRE